MLLRDKWSLLLALCSSFSPHSSSFAFFRLSSCSSSSRSSSFLFHSSHYFSCSFSFAFVLFLLFCLSNLSFCSFCSSSSFSEHFCSFSCSLPPSSVPCQQLQQQQQQWQQQELAQLQMSVSVPPWKAQQ